MKKKNGLIKTSLACSLIFGGIGLLTGCGSKEPQITISDIYVTGDYAASVKEFAIGSDVSLAGATVEVSFSNDSKETITVTDEMWTKTDYDFSTIGEKEITVRFTIRGEEKTETIKIRIVNPSNVQSVIDAIDDLEGSPVDRFLETTVDEIKEDYNELNSSDKVLVTNFDAFLSYYKLVKKDVIENYVTLANYEEEDRTTITNYISTAKTTIEGATSLENIDSAIIIAKTEINAISTTLAIKKAAVLEAFDIFVETTFNREDYSQTKWQELQLAIQTTRTELENVNDVNLLPDIANGYSNDHLMEIDTLVVENFKNRIVELPEPTTITTYNANLMEETIDILNDYENDLTYQEKMKISEVLMDKVEAVEFALGTIDLNAYKVSKISLITEFLNKENEYDEEEWDLIVSLAADAIFDINSYTYSRNAKDDIDNRYEDLLAFIYNEESIKLKKINVFMNQTLTKHYSYVNSTDFVVNEKEGIYGVYNIFDNKFKINNKLYTIDDDSVSDGNNVYSISNGKFIIGTKVFYVVNVSTTLNDFKTLYNSLSERELNHNNALLAKELIHKYETVVKDKINYLNGKITMLKEYLDEDLYNEERIEEIQRSIDELRYTSISGYELDDYKISVDFLFNQAVEKINRVKNKLDDIKASIATQLTYNINNYYENERVEINEIIAEAIELGNAVIKGENETYTEATARVQNILDQAKNSINEVKTIEQVHVQEVIKLIGTLKEYINVEDYIDIESIEELDEELTNESADIVKAYKEAVTELNNTFNINKSLEYLNKTYKNVKEQIIDRVNKTYVKNLSVSELNEKISFVVDESYEGLSNNYYVEIANARNSIKNQNNTELAKYINNGNLYGNVVVNNNSYRYMSNYKVENDKLYLSLPYLLFNGPTITFNIQFGDLNTVDTYTINIEGIVSDGNPNIANLSGANCGDGSYDSESKILTSYREDAYLQIEYKNGENDAMGSTIAKVEGDVTYYYLINLNGQSIDVYPNGVDKDGWAIEEKASIDYVISIYNQDTGIQENALEFSYVQHISLEGAKDAYRTLLYDTLDEMVYLPEQRDIAQSIVDEFAQKYNLATSNIQLETLWESGGLVGEINTDSSKITIEGITYDIEEQKLKWGSIDIGTYNSDNTRNANQKIIINSQTWKIVEDGFVYLNDGNNLVKIGEYDSEQLIITLYKDITAATLELDNNVIYHIEGENLVRTYGNYVPSIVGNIIVEGENNINITLNEKQYISEGNNVIDENRLGFINRLNKVETVGDPIVTIGNVNLTLEESQYPNYGGRYNYEIKLSSEEEYLYVTGFDSSKVRVKLDRRDDEAFPYNVNMIGQGNHTIGLYLGDGLTLIREYELYITYESAVNDIQFNGKSINDGYAIEKRMMVKNTISIDVKEGYIYEVIMGSTGEIIDDLTSVILNLGRNDFYIAIYNTEGMQIDEEYFCINVGEETIYNIKFNGKSIIDNYVDVYDNGNATSVIIDYSMEDDITSLDILDLEGNSLLDNQGKLNVDGLPFVKFKIKFVAGGVTYESQEYLLINTNEYGLGEIWIDREVDSQNIFGLNRYVELKYDSHINLLGGIGNVEIISERKFAYETYIAPKGYDSSKISVVINEDYTGEGSVVLTRIDSTNIYKLVVKNQQQEVDSVMYYIIEESEDSIDNNASMCGGIFTVKEYMNDYLEYEFEEMEPILEEKKVEFNEVTYSNTDPYYLEGIDKYYIGEIKADAGDIFYAWGNNDYQKVTVTADFLFNVNYDSPFYLFMNNFDNTSVIIVDSISSDGTTHYRYIYNIEKAAPTFSTQLVIDAEEDASSTNQLEFRENMSYATEGMLYGDFYGAYTNLFVGFVGEINAIIGDEVTLKFSVSEDALQTGRITLTGNYDKDDETSYLNENDLKGVKITVTSFDLGGENEIPSVTFYSHVIDVETKEELQKVQFVVFLCEDFMKDM